MYTLSTDLAVFNDCIRTGKTGFKLQLQKSFIVTNRLHELDNYTYNNK